jgi:hypothetical protein
LVNETNNPPAAVVGDEEASPWVEEYRHRGKRASGSRSW